MKQLTGSWFLHHFEEEGTMVFDFGRVLGHGPGNYLIVQYTGPDITWRSLKEVDDKFRFFENEEDMFAAFSSTLRSCFSDFASIERAIRDRGKARKKEAGGGRRNVLLGKTL
jgi:hypothetical protein